MAFDLRPLRDRGGQDVRGVLGMDFLWGYVVAIDFDRGSLTFRQQVGDTRTLGQPLLMSSHQNVPYLTLDFQGDGQLEAFEIDTGHVRASSGDLDSNLFRALLKAGKLRDVAPGGFSLTASGKHPEIDGRLQALSVGTFNHRNLLFSAPSTRSRLGLRYWSRYAVTFDFPGRALYLKPGAQFDRLDLPDRSGLDLARLDGTTIVERVGKGSPAAQAGIRPKDVLRAVAGLRADQESLFALRCLLRNEGRTVAVTIKRGAEEREVSLPLGGWPPPLTATDIEPALREAP